uniref:hypothetical protein n=1 Tax=Cellvibrio fontiphilus TaxID=1815559 RepID=UPI002B4C1261|nr:hypothetical protein [Cellvibrio fontiphilus]
MPTPSAQSPASTSALSGSGNVVSGICARLLIAGLLPVAILWLLVIYSLGIAGPVKSPSPRSLGFTHEAPLHLSGDYFLSLKRFFSRAQNQSGSDDSPNPLWLLLAEFLALVAVGLASIALVFGAVPTLKWPQHLSLNIPRAPPLF